MLSPAISDQLEQVRRREHRLSVLWGAARWLALAVLVVFCIGFSDWLIDRSVDTPLALRAFLLVAGTLFVLGSAWWMVVVPWRQRLSRDAAAHRVERRFPQFDYRLITAVQLNRRRARTEGMSPALIDRTSQEAERLAGQVRFLDVVDTRRVRWSTIAFLSTLVVAVLPALLFPATASALLARMVLLNRPIPRSIALEPVTEEVWPSGDPVPVRFLVRGAASEGLAGTVRVVRTNGRREDYPLVYDGPGDEEGDTQYLARINASSESFQYYAWLGDGRTHEPGTIRYEPRPELVRWEAWCILPEFLGRRPDRSRYEEPQEKGDVSGYAGSGARVRVEIQKPVEGAWLEILGTAGVDGEADVRRRLDMRLDESGRVAEAQFDLREDETAYRIRLRDRLGFMNAKPSLRSLTLLPDEKPQVAWLPERLPGSRDAELSDASLVDGMPIPVGGSIPIGYVCSSPLGLDRAQLRFRVNDGPWQRLPLGEVQAGSGVGSFDFRRGVFDNSGLTETVEFHAVPSPDPKNLPPRLRGGGRFDFLTRALAELKPGDQVEYMVEVFDRNPTPDREPGRTEPARVKRVVTVEELADWIEQTLQQERRLRDLEKKQQGVFDPKLGSERP